MKVSGAELLDFLAEDGGGWPGEDWYWDHDLFEEPVPTEIYDTDAIGPLIYEGSDPALSGGPDLDLGRLIKKWRLARDFQVVVVTVKNQQADSVREFLTAHKIKWQ